MYSPKSAAASFVHTLCTTRQKGNLEALMQQARPRRLYLKRHPAAALGDVRCRKYGCRDDLFRSLWLRCIALSSADTHRLVCCAQIVTVFGEYQAAHQAAQGPAGGPVQPVPETMARRLDGALLAIGTLSDTLKKTVSAPGLTC